MIHGIGTDIVETLRFKKRLDNEKFLSSIFTDKEQSYCFKKKSAHQHFAARFAAKESYMKAIGLGWSSAADFTEIEVHNNTEGKPVIILHGNTLIHFEKSGLKDIFVSLSHVEDHATAQVIITK